MLADTTRQRIYISNSGMNRIEVFDMKTQTLMAPIKVGQLPHSMAFGNDGSTLYVASTGGEAIDIVNLDTGQKTGRVKFPPLPFNAAFALITPTVLALEPARAADSDVGRNALAHLRRYGGAARSESGGVRQQRPRGAGGQPGHAHHGLHAGRSVRHPFHQFRVCLPL